MCATVSDSQTLGRFFLTLQFIADSLSPFQRLKWCSLACFLRREAAPSLVGLPSLLLVSRFSPCFVSSYFDLKVSGCESPIWRMFSFLGMWFKLFKTFFLWRDFQIIFPLDFFPYSFSLPSSQDSHFAFVGSLHGTHLDFSSSLPFGPLSLWSSQQKPTHSVSEAFSSAQSRAPRCSSLDFTLDSCRQSLSCQNARLDWT